MRLRDSANPKGDGGKGTRVYDALRHFTALCDTLRHLTIERGVPRAYVRARASSATLCSVHVLWVFLCVFSIKRNLIRIKTGLDTYLIRIQTRARPVTVPPL